MKYVFLLVAVSLVGCASQPVQVEPQVKVKKHAIDMSKVKTVQDVKALVSLLLPENPAIVVREDSLTDSKRLEAVKHLLKEEK
jgi:hypothetical protein